MIWFIPQQEVNIIVIHDSTIRNELGATPIAITSSIATVIQEI